jgi:hypothetical protein
VFTPITRRRFVANSLAAGALSGLGDFGFLSSLPAAGRDDRKTVPLSEDLEPLVRLIEDTPREDLLADVATRIKGGTSYQQLLGAVMLAGVRGIKPRPVGFKFHAVLVINSAHLASLAASDKDRWLPLFWAIDNFKVSQAKNKEEGGWMMAALDETKLPTAATAKDCFIHAMDDWDEAGTDRAIAALARTASSTEILELFWRYGCRDFRDIGHKAIYVANGSRTLNTIGWRHAEPVLRSLAFALLEHEGDNPAKRDAEPDRPFRENLKRAAAIGARWQDGKLSPEATADMLAAIRTGTWTDACDKVVELRKKGVNPRSVWDGLFLGAGELLMRQPGIVGLHCVTSVNALHYGYQTTGNDETRRLLMLQAAAFLQMFRKAMAGRGKIGDGRLDTLEKAEVETDGVKAFTEILTDVTKDRTLAARKTLALLEGHPHRAKGLMAAARGLLFTKGRDSHDYKFSSAALEDYYHVSPRWRATFMASSMFNLRGAGERDNDLIRRTREALAKG